MQKSHKLDSTLAALEALERLDTLSIQLSKSHSLLNQVDDLTETYTNTFSNLQAIWSFLRKLLVFATWDRSIDFYNSWQVHTYGHDAQLAMSENDLANAVQSSIKRVLPSGYSATGLCSVKILQPNLTGSTNNDLISIKLPLILDQSSIKVEFELYLVGYLDFSEFSPGKFVLVSAPRIVSNFPVDRKKISRDLERQIHHIRLINRNLWSQLGDLTTISFHTSGFISIFARLGHRRKPRFISIKQTIPDIHPPDKKYDLAVIIPQETYVVGLYRANGGSIFDRGPIDNPYGVGANKVYWFGVKSKNTSIDINIDLGSFGSFNYRFNPQNYIFFHLCFDVLISNGVAELIAITRLASDGSIVAKGVVRQIPDAESATTRISDQQDLEFWVQRKN